MKTTATIAALALVSGLAAAHAWAQANDQPDADTIMHRMDENRKLDGSESVATLTIRNASGQERVRKIASVSRLEEDGTTEKRLLRFLEPADVKGTGLLTFDYESEDDDLWFFMPAIRKTRRIVASEKAKSFMGSEFTYADVTPPSIEDFAHKLLRVETVRAVECWVVESTAKSDDVADENGYWRRVVFLGKDDYTPRRAVYYDLSGELWKELNVLEVREVDEVKHRYRPIHMTMENLQNGRSSEMVIEEIELRRDVPDEYFTTRYLERQ